MPKFSQSDAANVDTSISGFPIIRAGDLADEGATLAMYAKRLANTQFGEAMFVDFEYADDPYDPEGNRPRATVVFSEMSPAYKQLSAVALTADDPLECVILHAGKTFKLGESVESNPTPPQVSKTVAHATTNRNATTSGRAAAPASHPTARTTRSATSDADELPF